MDLKNVVKEHESMLISVRTRTKINKNKSTALLVFLTQVSTLVH